MSQGHVIVPLSLHEVERVLDETKRRVVNALRMKGQERFNASYNCIEGHALGAAAELAASKFLGLEWDPVRDDFSPTDVGGYEVRETKVFSGDFKACCPHEPAEKLYLAVGVTNRPWVFRVVGWISGREAWHYGQLIEVNGWPAAWFVNEAYWNQFDWDLVAPWREPLVREAIEKQQEEIRARRKP